MLKNAKVLVRIPEFSEAIKKGWTYSGIQRLGASERTFEDYKQRYPQFLQAIKRGKAPVDFEVEGSEQRQR